MNWLITGGCGFIGRALIQHLLREGRHQQGAHQIRVLDNLSVGTRDDLKEVTSFNEANGQETVPDWQATPALIVGDILDPLAIDRAIHGADVVVHLAANTGVAPSVENPKGDCETNVLGTLNMLEACRLNDAKRFVFASSGAPLGVQVPPLHEEMAPKPASPYGASKLAGEGYCSAFYHCFGVETVVLRFGNVYGEGSTKKASIVAKFIKQAMAGETLEVYGDGSQTRDFIYVGDLINAVYLAATTPNIGGETFQIATAFETSVGELTEKLLHALKTIANIDATCVNAEQRAGDVARNYSDTRKAAKLLKWKPAVGLDEGLERTVRFFVESEEKT